MVFGTEEELLDRADKEEVQDKKQSRVVCG